MITGESMPVMRLVGDPVIGATLNGSGSFVMRATRVGSDTVLAQIVRMVETAQGSKAPIARLADRISARFVPVVLLLAAATFGVWFLLGPTPAVTHAMVAAISVLIIACPCAMGLATPTAIMVGTGRAAESGILIRGGASLESAGEVDTVIFDKTGTLTLGRPEVVSVATAPGVAHDDLLAAAAAVEAGSGHPLATAIVAAASARPLAPGVATAFTSIAGLGVEARVGDARVLVGSARYLEREGVDLSALDAARGQLAADAQTAVFVARDGRAAGRHGHHGPGPGRRPGGRRGTPPAWYRGLAHQR